MQFAWLSAAPPVQALNHLTSLKALDLDLDLTWTGKEDLQLTLPNLTALAVRLGRYTPRVDAQGCPALRFCACNGSPVKARVPFSYKAMPIRWGWHLSHEEEEQAFRTLVGTCRKGRRVLTSLQDPVTFAREGMWYRGRISGSWASPGPPTYDGDLWCWFPSV